MAARLILISNRVAIPNLQRGRAAGGLAVAVRAALRQRPGVWFGWSGDVADTPARAPRIIGRNQTTYAVIDLSSADYQEYYNGFANRVLWPILHYRVDLSEYSRIDQKGYLRVNSLFADNVSRILAGDDLIWVHDYHILPMARELKGRGHENPIGFFLHIPFPPSDIAVTLPRHADLFGALLDYDLVGFQTENDRDNFANYVETNGLARRRDATTLVRGDRVTRIGAFPVGIETGVFARLARNAERSDFAHEFRNSLTGTQLIVGVDRLDYSKGLPARLDAYDRFLDRSPEWRGRVTYLQITPASRSAIPEYAEIDRAVGEQVGHINGRHGEPCWTPIRYVNRAYSRTALSSIYRASRVALVTPLRDGMNLVAKEFIAAQDPADPGVLVLSKFAGAAVEMDSAILFNPHEIDATADAILSALEMPADERKARFATMYERIAQQTVNRWADEFLATLIRTRQGYDLLGGLRAMFREWSRPGV